MYKTGLNLESSWIRPRRTRKTPKFYIVYCIYLKKVISCKSTQMDKCAHSIAQVSVISCASHVE